MTIWNKACERATGIPAEEVIGTKEHWKGFYEVPRPCLADLIVQRRTAEISTLYETHTEDHNRDGFHVENWCPMPRIGSALYLAIDAGAMYDSSGAVVAVVETLRDLTSHKRVRMDLERVATADTLTGISNRRGFDQALVAEWGRSMRFKEPVTLLLVEVDFFSQYTDAYGRAQGDECLRSVANAVRESAHRPSDTVARHRGHVFAVLLPSTESTAGQTIAERIMKNVAAKAITHLSSVTPVVSVSIGVASMVPERDVHSKQLLVLADNALAVARRAGCNRVEVCHAKSHGVASLIRRLLPK